MSRFAARWLLLIFPSLLGYPAWAQTPTAHLTKAKARKSDSSASRAIAPISRQQLFGTLALATRSEEARTLIETAIDQYENVVLDASIASSRKATEKDPHSALAYAVWSFAARRGEPAPEALQRAKNLAPHATADERLLVDWMLDVQQGNMLLAIRTMNDLLARFPNDKHILYLTSEWLYFQQDYDRSRKMMEKMLELDANFAPALNMLGYANIEAGEPNPDKAIDYLKANFESPLHFWYGHYYAAHAMHQVGGKEWEDWYARVCKTFLPLQGRDGSWTHQGRGGAVGPVYETSIAVIILSVPADYLPIFQR